MNMQMKFFPYRTTGCENLSNCITDYIKTGNSSGLNMFFGLNYVYLFFVDDLIKFLRFSLIFINMKICKFTPLTTEKKTRVSALI